MAQAGHESTGGALIARLREQLEDGQARNRRRSEYNSALGHFLASVYQPHLLTRQETEALSRLLQTGRTLRQQHGALEQQLGRQPTAEELATLPGIRCAEQYRQALAHADEARDLLVRYNLGLVVMLAKRYQGCGMDVAELIPAGLSGLAAAADGFDPSRGAFTTYAMFRVRSHIRRCISQHARVVRIPDHVQAYVAKIRRAARELDAQPGRLAPTTAEEIGTVVGMAPARVLQYLRAAREPRSLDDYAFGTAGKGSGDAGEALLDTIAAFEEEGDGPQELAEGQEDRQKLEQDLQGMLFTLPRREREVVVLRYGLGPQPPLSAQEVGQRLGVSGWWVRQVEAKAVNKLRAPYRQQTFLRDWV